MSIKLPKVRIQHGYLLQSNLEALFTPNNKSKSKRLSEEELNKKIDSYRREWQKYEETILEGMCSIFGIEFRQNIIDVYIVPGMAAFSDPLVIGVGNSPDEFVDTLTHELLHRLFTDNLSIPYQKMVLQPEWEKLLGKNHDFATFVHIPVHSALKEIYLDILKQPSRYERDKGWAIKNEKRWGPAYKKAWEYVEKHDYNKLNKQIKDIYKKLSIKYKDQIDPR